MRRSSFFPCETTTIANNTLGAGIHVARLEKYVVICSSSSSRSKLADGNIIKKSLLNVVFKIYGTMEKRFFDDLCFGKAVKGTVISCAVAWPAVDNNKSYVILVDS